jgi:subtilase family serine protease
MRRLIALSTGMLAASLLFLLSVPSARAAEKGKYVAPASSQEQPAGFARTHILVWQSNEPSSPSGPPPNSETPGSIACVYKLVTQVKGCPIATSTAVPTAGVGAIALVDAYDNPDAATDLQVFDNQFGLPAATFQTVYASGKQPQYNGGWALEEALDIEMAHAMAPNAKIFLVEAASNSSSDLYTAEQVASNLVVQNGGGTVSNSWSGGEYSGEVSDSKKYFSTSGVVYFASTGDAGQDHIGVPAVMATVVGAGGTEFIRNGKGAFTGEQYWTGGGGGLSQYVSRPAYQNIIKKIVGSKRGIPDFGAIAVGVAMYDQSGSNGGWNRVAGTSISSPLLAGVVDGAGKLRKTTNSELTTVYKEYGNSSQYKKYWTDITAGSSVCKKGWDFCDGVGTPIGYAGK